jgi:hypothetical protein
MGWGQFSNRTLIENGCKIFIALTKTGENYTLDLQVKATPRWGEIHVSLSIFSNADQCLGKIPIMYV